MHFLVFSLSYEKGKLTPFSITNNRPSCLAAKLGVQAICPTKGALELFHLMQCFFSLSNYDMMRETLDLWPIMAINKPRIHFNVAFSSK